MLFLDLRTDFPLAALWESWGESVETIGRESPLVIVTTLSFLLAIKGKEKSNDNIMHNQLFIERQNYKKK